MKAWLSVLVMLLVMMVGRVAFAIDCEGPPELCAQLQQLQQGEASTQKLIAIALALTIGLKTLISVLKAISPAVASDKAKAWIRIAVILFTLIVGVTSSIGLGVPWWQALILAASGPLSISLNELMKLLPVVKGKAPLPPEVEKIEVKLPPSK